MLRPARRQRHRHGTENLVEKARDGKWSAEENGTLKADHTYWKGFPARTAVGLTLEQRKP
ncbi:MAG: hypothetical protein ABI434_11905 [Burkholderiaceae bacterium]